MLDFAFGFVICFWYRSLPFYRDSCNKLKGTEGTLFGKRLKRNQPLYIYNAHLCRTIKLNFVGLGLCNKEISFKFFFRIGLSEPQILVLHSPTCTKWIGKCFR